MIFVIKIVHGGGVHVKIKTLDINVRVFHTSLLFDGVGGGGRLKKTDTLSGINSYNLFEPNI